MLSRPIETKAAGMPLKATTTIFLSFFIFGAYLFFVAIVTKGYFSLERMPEAFTQYKIFVYIATHVVKSCIFEGIAIFLHPALQLSISIFGFARMSYSKTKMVAVLLPVFFSILGFLALVIFSELYNSSPSYF